MTIAAYRGRCPHCGHDHDQILFHTSDREELDRLRAEVANLKADTNRQLVAIAEYDAEVASLKEERDELIHMHSNDGHCIVDLTQQLAVANERIKYLEYYREDK